MSDTNSCTTAQIISMIQGGPADEDWYYDVIEALNWTGDEDEDKALLIQCAKFLENFAPGRSWSIQEFKTLTDSHLTGRWESEEALGRIRAAEAVEDGEMTEETFGRLEATNGWSDYLKRKGTRIWKAADNTGGIISFDGLDSLSDLSN